ncbi:MAG: hypothetical protein KatS3mg017_0093 [Fimbriimonadales bacterium]|nr:MAG: hypothetical protein KatS3mg017_0093 [Fimbriimonadales bacterium]GIV09831.1 MAG: hypothetical protein KatS3mg019_1922 [Fimbriimonadales bacterium]
MPLGALGRVLQGVGACLLLLCLSACARFPDTPDGGGVRRIAVEVQVAGRIRPEYRYFVLFNLSNDATGQVGPVPVVAPPWGNGFAAGVFTHFMQFDNLQPAGGYALYRVQPNTNLSVFQYLGAPRLSEPVNAASDRIRFEIDLTQFLPNPVDAAQMQFVQLNIIATDRIPIDPNDLTPKIVDALGDPNLGVSQYLNLRIDQNRIVRNADANLEPRGDVPDPDLDIVDWRVEVRAL